ncbi:hypothetical protein MnTg02_03033 [bacterium MnTg02]|nr:hypothetical protein MnTg02_03033 [bacterium MnTg02]
MGQFAITLNGRTFRLRCKDGEEERLLEFSDYVSAHLDQLEERVGRVGHDRLLVMAALTITGELFDAREKLEQLKSGHATSTVPPAAHQPATHIGVDPKPSSRIAQSSRGWETI